MDNAFFRIDGSRYGTGFGAASVDGQNSHTYNDAFSVFFAGGGFYGSNDARADSMGFDYNSWSASVGGDVKLSDTLLLGSAFGFTSGSANVDGGVGSLDADTYSFTGYFGSNWANGFYLDGALGYAFSDYNSSRTVSIGAINNTYEGDTTGHSILARVQAGYDYENDGWKIGPVGDLSIVHTKVGDFTEAGGGVALNVGSQDISSVQGGFGLRTDYRLKQDWGSLVMRGKAMVVHEFGDTDRTVNTSFVGGLPAGWNTPVTTGSDTFVLLNAGISAVLANNGASNIALGLDYNGRIGDGVSEHRGTVSVKFLW
ncbi:MULTISPECIES: autotransporter outer membrane beta-barrel domain-containing protein [Alphaproteobacteria]|nr:MULTISPECIES: autotransporter outer membrane beta-barrel domain-containing protein [Alphaproteobacteria]